MRSPAATSAWLLPNPSQSETARLAIAGLYPALSGDYYHDAYWSVGEQGFENVSHGCVNLAPDDAETYYNLAVPGDPSRSWAAPRAAPGTTAGPSGS